ncbi:hypothetical protein L218DRAFT_964648 [Marasmius fiardii PR-910]|nr:hypothetical protein L218DRAFT_964648 [Marasmius fiardii PR-910]
MTVTKVPLWLLFPTPWRGKLALQAVLWPSIHSPSCSMTSQTATETSSANDATKNRFQFHRSYPYPQTSKTITSKSDRPTLLSWFGSSPPSTFWTLTDKEYMRGT